MTNILSITLHLEYTDIVFFSKCFCDSYFVDVNDFVRW